MTRVETLEMKDIFDRTLKNCEFYEKENNTAKLLNEIGCLRGIAYCLEVAKISPYSDKFLYYINIQNQLND